MGIMFLQERNFERDDNQGTKLLAVTVVFLTLATLAVIFRFVSRRIKRVRLAADDYMIIVALAGAYGNGLAELVGVSLGVIGQHRSQLSTDQIKMAVKCLVATETTWAVSIWALKVSLLLLFIRIFTQKSFRVIAYILMGIVTLFCVASILLFFLNCRPLTAPKCGSQYAAWISTGAINLATDIAVLSLPIPSVWRLQLPKITRLALTAIFCIGFLVCIITILRIASIPSISPTDLTYTSVKTDIYSILEPCLGIILACLPITRPLFEKMVPPRLLRLRGIAKNQGGATRASGLPPNLIRVGKDASDFHKLPDDCGYPIEMVTEETRQKTLGLDEDDRLPLGNSYHAEIKSNAAVGLPPNLKEARPDSRINVTREWSVR